MGNSRTHAALVGAVLLVLLATGAVVATAVGATAVETTGEEEALAHHTVGSPEWLRLSAVVSSSHPYPGVRRSVFLRYYTDPMRADVSNPLWRRTFGDYFEYIFPYQGLPGVLYQPAGWMTPKVGEVNSVRNINYEGMGKATNMLHRKGVWLIPHCPAMQWWGASSDEETPQEGAVLMNMALLSLETPPDGFNFDAWLESGADIAAIRRKADEVLPRGHYSMHAESHVADPPGFNTHYMYLFGRRLKAWDDDLYGLHYLWFAVRGLLSHGQSPFWGQRLVRVMMWDSLFWGGSSPWVDMTPSHYYDRWRTQEFVGLTRLLWRQGDLQGLVRDPVLLPEEDLLQDGFAVNVFDGAAPAYFRAPDHPGADKRIYAFKTGGAPVPFGDASYYDAMPPVPERGPSGDLFSTSYEPGYHFVSAGIDGTWRTPTRREGDRIVVSARNRLARYGTFPADGETIWVVRYKNILSVGRSDRRTLRVRVNKTYTENLLVEVQFRRADFDDHETVVSRPVINQQAVISIPHDLAVSELRPADELCVRLLREHVLDRWHIPYLLCDEVPISGGELGVYASIRSRPEGGVARGGVVGLEAEVGNDGSEPRTVQLTWELPKGWRMEQGEPTQRLDVPAYRAVRASIRARVGDEAPFGGQKVSITADPAEAAGGVAVNLGIDSALVVVAPGDLGDGGEDRQLVSVETGGFKGMSGVTIPVSHGMACPEAGKAFKVIEYDAAGQIVGEAIPGEYVRVNDKRGTLSWVVVGNEEPYRNFCIATTDGQMPPGRAELMLSTEHVPFPPGHVDTSEVKHKYAVLEIKMAVPYSMQHEAWVGFKNALPEGWTWRRFDPDNAQSLMAWRFHAGEDEHPIVAMFDNGSGMVEISSGKQLEVEDHGTVDCDKVWGDFGWPAANARLDRVDAAGAAHVYRLEWQRLFQRWYIDGRLVYERQIALDEPLPLMIENRTEGHLGVNWIRASSPYCRK